MPNKKMVPDSAPKTLFLRKIIPGISKYLNSPGAILLVGARQVGKTSLLHLLMDELVKTGTPHNSIHYLDLEDFTLLDILNAGPKECIAYLQASGADLKGKNFVFIDEIQYLDNPTNFLKLLTDHHKNLKPIVSGSSTLEIRRKFKDSLAGRKVVFEVFPLDFYEFLAFKGENALADALAQSDLRRISLKTDTDDLPVRFFKKELERYFNEYLIFGGYPAVVLEPDYEKKTTYLQDIYSSYIKKDIKDLMRVDNVTAFNNLLKVLALQIGNLVNITELCTAVKIARETLERYLFLLENTFILKLVSPFSGNPRKEISKMSKVYFIDTGLRNVIIRNQTALNERVDQGPLVENGVFINILKNLGSLEEVHFWRTLAKNEVDFVIVKGQKSRPIEVKYSHFKSAKVPIGIRNFQKEYGSEDGLVMTRDYFGKSEKTLFLPAWLC